MQHPSESARRKPRSPEVISPTRARQLDTHLLAYALAATGVVALAPVAGAEVVYTPVQAEILGNTKFPIDFNHDGMIDFYLHHDEHGTSAYRGGFLALGGSDSAGVIARKLYLDPGALPKGFPIGADSPRRFHRLNGREALMANAFCYPLGQDCAKDGNWVAAINKFLGLRFVINGEIHYGWARLTVSTGFTLMHMVTASLTGYAYETEPNKTIKAGDIGVGDDAADDDTLGAGELPDVSTMQPVSAPGTLGALAQGSEGLQIWRQLQQ